MILQNIPCNTLCSSHRGAAADECDCDKLDFVAARALSKEGLDQFIKDRTSIAALNDRLVRLIKLVRTSLSPRVDLKIWGPWSKAILLYVQPFSNWFWSTLFNNNGKNMNTLVLQIFTLLVNERNGQSPCIKYN